jgi:type IV secretory pathway VirB10-like protein
VATVTVADTTASPTRRVFAAVLGAAAIAVVAWLWTSGRLDLGRDQVRTDPGPSASGDEPAAIARTASEPARARVEVPVAPVKPPVAVADEPAPVAAVTPTRARSRDEPRTAKRSKAAAKTKPQRPAAASATKPEPTAEPAGLPRAPLLQDGLRKPSGM